MTIHQKTRFITALLAVALPLALAGCGGSDSGSANPQTETGTFFGPSQVLGSGTARSFVTLNAGVPQSVGMKITAGALLNEPPGPPPLDGIEYKLTLPPEIAATPFLGASLYYTQGHPPAGQFDVPHFHPVFFLIDDAVRSQITATSSESTLDPAPSDLPKDHINVMFPLPGIGGIFIDPTDPATQERPFHTTDLDFGFFNRKMSSMNVTIALAFMNAKQSVTLPIKQPQTYPKPGYYPIQYTVSYDPAAMEYTAALTSFVLR